MGLLGVGVDDLIHRGAAGDGGAVEGAGLHGAAVVDGGLPQVHQHRRGGVPGRHGDAQGGGGGGLVGQGQVLQRDHQLAAHGGEVCVVLCNGGEEVGRGQLLAAGGKVQPVAEGRLLRHGDDRRFAGLALDALLAFLAGVALFALGADLPLDALLPDGALFAHRAPFPLFAPLAPGNLRSCGACGTLDGHIGAAGVRLAAAAPAGPGIVIYGSLPLMKIVDCCPMVCPGRGGGA